MSNKDALRLPVVSESAEYLVMGHLMRRNILAYKAPHNYEGYDLICIHPSPRHAAGNSPSQLRIQVKSRYQTDSDKSVPLKAKSIDAFDFLIVVFLNIGEFKRGRDGSEGQAAPEFYTLPPEKVQEYFYDKSAAFTKVRLKTKSDELEKYKNELGFEQIAIKLGVSKPTRELIVETEEFEDGKDSPEITECVK
jgi:hypothetical protein